MKSSIKLAILGIASFCLGTLSSSFLGTFAVTPSEAHSSSYFSHTWANQAVQIGVGGSVSTLGASASTVLSNADSAGQTWDNLGSATGWGYFTNSNYSNTSIVYNSNPCAGQYATNSIEVWIHARPLSSQAGNQSECEWGTRVYRSNVRFDTSNRTWHFGYSDPASWKTDFRGIATHELGHSTGFDGHFPKIQPGPCKTYTASTDDTMCPSFTGTGQYLRTLGSHDIHTFQAGY